MKNKIYFISTIVKLALVLVLFTSCSSNSSKIEVVKLFPVKSGNEFEYIDSEGKIIINPQFSEATVFRNGLALVRTAGDEQKWGYITVDGKYAINATYKVATVFSEDLAWVVVENGAPTAINKKGEVKITLQNAQSVRNFKEGLAAFSLIDSIGTKWGFIDKEGKVKINPQFNSAGNFSDGKCAVQNSDGKVGYIDKEGKIVINFQFGNGGDFANGKAVVIYDNKSGVIDGNGKYVINPQFNQMVSDGNLYVINQGGKWGWCDKEGKIVINPQFEQASLFNGNDLAMVQSGGKCGYIDKEGKFVINPQFESALPFNGNMAFAGGKEGGFIDREGKYVINPQFAKISWDYITYISGGGTQYLGVNTDYFDMNTIVDKINVNQPEGISLDSKLSDIIKKLNIAAYPSDYAKKIFENKRISNDAIYSLTIYSVDTPDAKVNTFFYQIYLRNKGVEKRYEIRSAVEKTFIGYEEDINQAQNGWKIFNNSKNKIMTHLNGNIITISIYPNYDFSSDNGIEEAPILSDF